MSSPKVRKANSRQKTPQEILARYELDEVDKAILKLKVQHPAIALSEIAQILGIHRGVVRKRIKKTQWQSAYDEFFLPAKSILEKEVTRLTRKYLKLADSPDVKVSERVIRAILISAGVLRNKFEVDSESFEPIIITRPLNKDVIEITTKQLTGGKKE